MLIVFGDIIDSNGVASIEKDTTLATDFENFVSIIGATSSHQRRAIVTALRLALPLQFNVAIVTPKVAPTVTNQPVVAFKIVGSVANKLNGCKCRGNIMKCSISTPKTSDL